MKNRKTLGLYVDIVRVWRVFLQVHCMFFIKKKIANSNQLSPFCYINIIFFYRKNVTDVLAEWRQPTKPYKAPMKNSIDINFNPNQRSIVTEPFHINDHRRLIQNTKQMQ
jgi:hypothetical protein